MAEFRSQEIGASQVENLCRAAERMLERFAPTEAGLGDAEIAAADALRGAVSAVVGRFHGKNSAGEQGGCVPNVAVRDAGSSPASQFHHDRAWHGDSHPENGKPDNGGDAFYFVVAGPDEIGGRLSGFVTREQFDWLAKQLGVPGLP